MVELQVKFKIKAVQTDGGGSFVPLPNISLSLVSHTDLHAPTLIIKMGLQRENIGTLLKHV